MELFPAIDVQGGRVARAPVEPGGGAAEPLARARAFAAAGARWVHFVDLDRAFGRGDNRELARRFLAAATIPVQVGGGLRTESAVEELLGWGARRVAVAAPTPDAGLVERLLGRHGAERIAVAIDSRDGRVAPRGGAGILDLTPFELAGQIHAQGVRTVIYTDAARDGMLSGPDIEGARAIAVLGLDVVLSGGVAALDDLRRARSAGLAGVIVGRALHEGRFTLAEALACVA